MERPVNGDMLYVFAFVTSSGSNGLDERTRSLLIPALYKLLSVNCNAVLDQMYEKFTEKDELSDLQALDDAIL